MNARVSQYRIIPGKIEEFARAVDSVRPLIRKQEGFRALITLRTGDTAAPEAMIISVWDSLEELRASEKSMFLYQALSRLLGLCQGFPAIHEHEVLASEFAAD